MNDALEAVRRGEDFAVVIAVSNRSDGTGTGHVLLAGRSNGELEHVPAERLTEMLAAATVAVVGQSQP